MLKQLRDPIWQAIGTLVGVVAIIIATLFTNKDSRELVIARGPSASAAAFIPNELLAQLQSNMAAKISHVTVEYFIVSNHGNKAIKPQDIIEPITVSTSRGRLVLVSECPEKWSVNGLTSNVSLTWKQAGANWIAGAALFNPNDLSCFAVFSETDETQTETNFRSRIADAQFTYHSEWPSYIRARMGLAERSLLADIRLSGWQIYALAFLQILLFMTMYIPASIANRLCSGLRSTAAKLAGMILLASASAEILTTLMAFPVKELHFISWPTLVLQVIVSTWLISLARNARRASPSAA